ncbi:UNVERIFIED_CONTAM: hypothetical protein ABIC26_004548 [Paenibacillus sp. PvR008]
MDLTVSPCTLYGMTLEMDTPIFELTDFFFAIVETQWAQVYVHKRTGCR